MDSNGALLSTVSLNYKSFRKAIFPYPSPYASSYSSSFPSLINYHTGNDNLDIHNLANDELISSLLVNSDTYLYSFYDQEQYILSYLQVNRTCQLVQIDLKTGVQTIPLELNLRCTSDKLLHMANSGDGTTPQIVLNFFNRTYLIVSNNGQVWFIALAGEFTNIFIV